MSISLTGPTSAVTTASLTSATYTFVADLAIDNRSKAFVVSALGGTQTGVTTNSIDKPKQFIVKRPAQYAQPSAYNSTSGRFGKVPKNVTRVIGRGACNVTATQVESIPMSLDIGIPAGGTSFDRANVEASVAFFLAGLWDQKEELIQALYDGQL